MELRQLRYFITTAKYLSFTRAAAALYISQPALSHQISELEQELKVRLFQRDRRNVTLTPEGERLLEYAEQVMSTVSAMENIGTLTESGPRQLRIGFDGADVPGDWFEESRVIAGFLNRNPNVQISAAQFSHTECEDKLLSGELDLALLSLRHHEELDPRLSSRTFSMDSIGLLVHPDTGVTTLEDAIHQLPMTIIKDRRKLLYRVQKSLNDLGLTPDLSYQDSMLACLILTQSGKASMLMPVHHYHMLLANNLRIIHIPGQSVQLVRATIWNSNNNNEALYRFLDATQGML